MKFTDGNWLIRKEVQAHWAKQAFRCTASSDCLTILAPTFEVKHPGDTLRGPALTVRITSPLEDVLAVRITHFEGGLNCGPDFVVSRTEPAAEISEDLVTSGALTAKISKDRWGIEFSANGEHLTMTPPQAMALMVVENEGPFIHDQLTLGVSELVYGFGERFTAFAKNGQVVDIWNEDGGTNSEQAYKNIPFYLTNRGYGVFVNHPGKVSFEVATEKTSRVGFSVAGEEMEYFVIYGPTPKEILRKYTLLLGRPSLLPAWSFGLWLSTSFTTNYDEASVTAMLDGMAERNIPVHVFHFDCFWMKAFQWTDLQWDPDVFPDPKGLLERLHQRGLKVSTWINPYIAQASSLFKEGKEFLLKKANGDIWQWDLWQPGMAIVDFTNPSAKAWFQAKLGALLDSGVDALKTDFGERIPTEVGYHDGSDPVRMHNYYPYLYNEAVFEVIQEKQGEAVVFARSATAGCQKFPVHWGGDCWSDYEAMADSLRGGLSLGLCGFGFWSHDIGGFEGTPPEGLYKRWVAFGLLSSHSRLHGSSSFRVPWIYDDEACDVLRFFVNLKCRLMPYLYSKAVEAHTDGTPMMRAMIIEFPDDPTCATLDRQYMLGDALLVAPVFCDSGEIEYFVPEGIWTSYLSGEEIIGGKWRKEHHDYQSLPLLVRPNTILAVGANSDRPDYEYAEGVTFEIYALQDGVEARCIVPNTRGETALSAVAVRHGNSATVEINGTGTWSILMVNVKSRAGERGLRTEAFTGSKSMKLNIGEDN